MTLKELKSHLVEPTALREKLCGWGYHDWGPWEQVMIHAKKINMRFCLNINCEAMQEEEAVKQYE